jgi:hypothetical protein
MRHGDRAAERGGDEGGVFFRQHHERERDGVGAEPATIVRRLEIFPEQPDGRERPEREEAVDEPMLRHVELRGRAGHERRDGEHRAITCEPAGKDGGDQQCEAGEERRDRAQRAERGIRIHGFHRGDALVGRIGVEGRTPRRGEEDVEEARRREERLFRLALPDHVLLRDLRVGRYADGVHLLHVALVEILVEADPLEAMPRDAAERDADGEDRREREPGAEWSANGDGVCAWRRDGSRRR